ncbi:hypothetical protein [Paenibacillus sp. V4I7]|uniref:hypothetical protein n=1 Tax=Paenibacillus sp. V4I7 TaxID=3042307 RepID=UPI0027870ECB|nr:hypothetical protein [Paenibacillus sp. V4I7]MDQ0899518.1 hypothetical protein [Paenibacillus sp. V4I7]
MSNYFSIHFTNDASFQFLSEKSVTNKFDNVTVFFEGNHGKICVFNDVIQEAIITLYNGLKNQVELNSDMEVGNLGEDWNIWTNNLADMAEDDEKDIFSNYWMWSTRDFQTWIYRKNEKSYIEISPSYRWHYVEPTEDENITSFNEFLEHYRANVFELSSEQIKDIIESLEVMKTELNIT